MSGRLKSAAGPRRNEEPDRAHWIVPAAIGILGFITVGLIVVALGVLLGLVHF